jgi:hypothetical protein
MTVSIDRLHTRVRSDSPVDAARISAWHETLMAGDGDGFASRWVREDEWLLVRRLPLALIVRPGAADSTVGQEWLAALSVAIDGALERGDAECVRYARAHHALADLLYRSALGDVSRQWAFRRMGFLPSASLPAREALSSGLAALARAELAWPVLVRLVEGERETAALTAVLRNVPIPAWRRVLIACSRTAPYAQLAFDSPQVEVEPVRPRRVVPGALPETALFLLDWARARPHLAERHLDTLAVLFAALVRLPEAAPARVLRARLESARAALRPPARTVQPRRKEAFTREVASGEAAASEASEPALAQTGEDAPRFPPSPALPELPHPNLLRPTRFGGALFWLRRVGASGVLADLGPAASEHVDGTALLLREIARALRVPDEDAAMDAFSGGHTPQVDAPDALVVAAGALVGRFESWLAEVAPELAAPRAPSVCRRDGTLRFEPGWIELRLRLTSVDTSVRRLGLDLDPGFLPWLGCTVRIHYVE